MTDVEWGGGGVLKHFENDLFEVRDAVTFGVFKIIKIRRTGDKDATLPAHDTVGKRKPSREDGAFVVMAVVVGAFEPNDLASRILVFAGANVIAAIFHDIHPPSVVPSNRNGAYHHRLRR